MDRFIAYYDTNMDLSDSGLAEADFIEDVMNREDFDTAKKEKYIKSLHKFTHDTKQLPLGSFTTMVKSGEIYLTD